MFVTCGTVCCASVVNPSRFNSATPKTIPIDCSWLVPRKSTSSFGGPTNLWVKSVGNGFKKTHHHQKSQNTLSLAVMGMVIPSGGMTSQGHHLPHADSDAKRMWSENVP